MNAFLSLNRSTLKKGFVVRLPSHMHWGMNN